MKKTTHTHNFDENLNNFSKRNTVLNAFLLICDAPDFWQLKLQDPDLTNFYSIHLGIFLGVLFFLVFLLEKKVFKNLSKQNKIVLLIILALIALWYKFYILCTYLFVGTIFLCGGVSRWKFTKEDLLLANKTIHDEKLPGMFEVKFHHVIFMILSLFIFFYCNILVGTFYFLFIVLGFTGALYKMNIYNIIPKKAYLYSKTLKKDSNTIRYHWSKSFFFLKVLNRLTLISLPSGTLFLAFMLPFYQENDPILLLNLYEIALVFVFTFVSSFLIDIYIILYGNSSVTAKVAMFCYRCAAFGTGGLLVGHIGEEQVLNNSFDTLGLRWHPTSLTNIPRAAMGQPVLSDYDQYHQYSVIKKYLPHIDQERYVYKRGFLKSAVDSTKTNEILKEHWPTISENATRQELARIRLGQGNLSGSVTRR